MKFTLEPDFAAAAEPLAADFKGIRNALPYCRLPYPIVWLEVAQAHRPRFAAANIDVPGIQSIPIRVGFLLQAMNEDHSIISVFQFWVLRQEPELVQASHMATLFDPREVDNPRLPPENEHRYIPIESSKEWLSADADTKRILNNVIRPIPAFFADPVLLARWGDSTEFDQITYELAAADWSGETAYLLAVLALLNTLNATTRREVDNSQINKKRVKRGDAPLNNHYELTIHPRIKKTMYARGRGATAEEIRSHLVRGHFKVRKTGIFWWRPHTAGRGGPPIEKSYKIAD